MLKTSTITLVPVAGLCNRMNAITSGILYAQNNPHVRLEILWNKNRDCFAHFTDLFHQLEDFPVKENRGWLNKPSTKRNLFLPSLLRMPFYDLTINDGSRRREAFDELVKGKRRIYVSSPNSFNQFMLRESVAEIFRPTEELAGRIQAVTALWNGNRVLGIHVRRTDNVQAIRMSPLENYYKAMEREIARCSDVCFYVASDDERVKKEIKDRYGSRIITSELTLERDSTEGMKDAVVELYCLAHTDKILGSCHSTYTLMASRLFSRTLEIV